MGRGGPRRVNKNTRAQRQQRDRPQRRTLARRVFPQARRRSAVRRLRHGDQPRRARAARDRDGARARATRRRPPTCSGMNRNTLRAKLTKYNRLIVARRTLPVDSSSADLGSAAGARSSVSRQVTRRSSISQARAPVAAAARHRAAVDRRHGEGAGRRGPAGHRCRQLHRIPRDARRPREDAASARCTAASSRAATSPRIVDALRAHAIPTDRPRRRQSLPVPRDGRQARLHARGRDREHRHRRAGDGARGGEELAARRRRRRSGGLSDGARRARGERRRRCRRDAFRAGAEGVRAHGRLRRRDRELADRARHRRRGARLPGRRSASRASKVQDLRYGENPHQRAAFYRDETPAPGTIATLPAAAGQGAVVQQHRRRRRRVGVREDVRRHRRA